METPPEDFPQMWQKPAFATLFDLLQSLRVAPPIWKLNDGTQPKDISEKDASVAAAAQNSAEIARYLSTVISSPLAWLEDDDQRDTIWTEASRRLSERCGRTGESSPSMGEITRTWPFESQSDYPPFELSIREPPLTGDSLGLKTWGSSYALARMLHYFAAGPLSHLVALPSSSSTPSTDDGPVPLPRPSGPLRVLELGSGTGLLGLAAAAIWQADLTLSDLPDIMPNLYHNVELNRLVVEAMGGKLIAGPLTWGGKGDDEVDPELFGVRNQFKIVLIADPLYDDDHPGLLASAIDQQLSRDSEARALVMVPQRDKTTVGLLASFKRAMSVSGLRVALPFQCIEEGLVGGQDDWGGDDDDETQKNVECWWGLFQRRRV